MVEDLKRLYEENRISQAEYFKLQRSIAFRFPAGQPCEYKRDWMARAGFVDLLSETEGGEEVSDEVSGTSTDGKSSWRSHRSRRTSWLLSGFATMAERCTAWSTRGRSHEDGSSHTGRISKEMWE